MTKTKYKVEFPVGYLNFHKKQMYNFQLNRWYSFGYALKNDLYEVAEKIDTFDDWKKELIKLAEKSESEGRLINATFYYRAAEFYIPPGDPDKNIIYNKFQENFNKTLMDGDDLVEMSCVPYEGSYLPCIKMKSATKEKNGVILMHGGFDSFIEELYSMMDYFSNQGYEVIAFDGPGQGNARRKYNVYFDYRWEKPTSAVIDYYNLDDVTILGLSLGGYLCIRAAAFENRIKRVIASSIAYDYSKFPPLLLPILLQILLFQRTAPLRVRF